MAVPCAGRAVFSSSALMPWRGFVNLVIGFREMIFGSIGLGRFCSWMPWRRRTRGFGIRRR